MHLWLQLTNTADVTIFNANTSVGLWPNNPAIYDMNYTFRNLFSNIS